MAKLVFMGTPTFALPILQALIDHHTVLAVVTQPDRPAGRKRQIQQSPVKHLALENNILVFQPDNLRQDSAIEELQQWQPDCYVVAAFGQILPQTVLDIPPHGSINIHASLLPRWRGAAPIQAAIRAGDSETGITLMLMDAGLDTGPMLSQRSIAISPQETGQSLHDRLAVLGAELLVETLPAYLSGKIKPQPQDDDQATYAPTIKKEEGHINWERDAQSIERLARAFTPWPGTYTLWKGIQLKIHGGMCEKGHAPPGQVVEKDGRIAIGTGDGLYYPTLLQLPGKKTLDIMDFLRGHDDFVGAALE
jgi:methionyl-tRNA formyltransferase